MQMVDNSGNINLKYASLQFGVAPIRQVDDAELTAETGAEGVSGK